MHVVLSEFRVYVYDHRTVYDNKSSLVRDQKLEDRNPAISVLLPVYNAELYLREAIDSVLAQSFGDFELLVLDDGSTDRSLIILREYEARDRRVRVLSRENRGLVASLNELLGEARGRYLARMDSDDVCMPQRFERQVMFLDSRPDHVAVGGWVMQMNAFGQPIGTIKSPTLHFEIDQAHLKGHTSICHPAVLIRKDAISSIGGYREEFMHAEDLDLWLRLAEKGRLANLAEVVLRYRLHASSISQANVESQQSALKRACESAWRRRGIDGNFEAVDLWRPTKDRASEHKFALQYGWTAWSHGYDKSWRTYAWKALRLRPFAISSWQLIVFGLLKKPTGDN